MNFRQSTKFNRDLNQKAKMWFMPCGKFKIEVRTASIIDVGNFVVGKSGLTDSSYMIKDQNNCFWELVVDDKNLLSDLPLNDTVISLFPTEVRGNAVLLRMDDTGLRDIPQISVDELKTLFKDCGIYKEPQECGKCEKVIDYLNIHKLSIRRLFWKTGLCPECQKEISRKM